MYIFTSPVSFSQAVRHDFLATSDTVAETESETTIDVTGVALTQGVDDPAVVLCFTAGLPFGVF